MRTRLWNAIVIAGAALTGGCSSPATTPDGSTPVDGGPRDIAGGPEGGVTPIGSGDLGVSPADGSVGLTPNDAAPGDGGDGDGGKDAGHPVGLGPIDAGLLPIDSGHPVGLGPRDY